MAALPLPRYTGKRGALNLACRLPPYALPPDLGPKLYLGFGALEADGSLANRATSPSHTAGTCLHVDMADAINILCHVEELHPPESRAQSSISSLEPPASAPTDGEGSSRCRGGHAPVEVARGNEGHAEQEDEAELAWLAGQGDAGGAVWDIWRAEDAPKIDAFLRAVGAERGGPPVAHGIHDGNFYVDGTLRKRLEAEMGVVGWRFVQQAGDAVFIPAGCPHQVLNLRSCVKVAMDFVSPENMRRCLALTEQFRQLPRGHARQQDPLSAKSVLLHATAFALSTLSAAHTSTAGAAHPAAGPSRDTTRASRAPLMNGGTSPFRSPTSSPASAGQPSGRHHTLDRAESLASSSKRRKASA